MTEIMDCINQTHMTHFSVYIHDLALAHTCNKLSSLNIQPHIWWPK